MKIALLSTYYPYRGGIAAFNEQLVAQLTKDNEVKVYNFTVQYPSFLFPGKTQMVEKGKQAPDLKAERVLNSLNPISWLKTANRIKDGKPDVLLLRYWLPFFSPSFSYVANSCRKAGIKVIAVIDNLVPHEKRLGDDSLNQLFLKNIDGAVVMSSVVENDLKLAAPRLPYLFRHHPMYNQFGGKSEQQEALARLGLHSNKHTILFFGLIRKYKGLDTLLEAFELLDEKYQLLIAGESYEDFAPYQKKIDNSGKKASIVSHQKFIPDNEVNLYFGAADVAALPYKTATQSGIVAIAYHFDLPVIVTDVGGLKSLVEPYQTGLVVDQNTPQELAKTIEQFFTKKEKWVTYLDGIKRFKKENSWEVFSKKLLGFAESL